MPLSRNRLVFLFLVLSGFQAPSILPAQDEEPTLKPQKTSSDDEAGAETGSSPKRATPVKKSDRRRYMTETPGRVDAGAFHVAFAAGGNFYIEPQLNATTKAPLGTYFKDFGAQGGVFFDYDYSELPDNIPLALRGMFGYKYILSSVHVFTFDGVVRRMFRLSEKADFGLGAGGSAAVWYRAITSTSTEEEVIFLPSFVIAAGFDFNPFMVDFKWLINRIGDNSTIMGWELYFGFRL